jgi:hypothetical protein
MTARKNKTRKLYIAPLGRKEGSTHAAQCIDGQKQSKNKTKSTEVENKNYMQWDLKFHGRIQKEGGVCPRLS